MAKRAAISTLACVAFLSATWISPGAEAARVSLPGLVPSGVAGLRASGNLPATNQLPLAIGLRLRNQPELQALIPQLYDPGSTNFHKYLTAAEFTARFGPTEADYEAVMRFARSNGLRVARTHSNRVVLEVEGSVSQVEQAFQIALRRYRDPQSQRDFFAPETEPSVPASLAVADLWGLSDYAQPTPLARAMDRTRITSLNYNGSGPGGAYQGRDFRNAYAPRSSLTGAGQIAAVVEFDSYYASDITTYEANCGYSHVPLTNVLLGVTGTPGYSGQSDAVAEVSLDIEQLIAMAPGLSKLMVYEGSNPYTVFNQIATDNTAKQISCSWSWSYGPTHKWQAGRGTDTLDSILSQMAAQGQSFFQASGDSDAYTGSQAVSSSTGPIPVDSIYVTSVGGTTLSMSGSGSAWAGETVWNWGNNTGSGGGVSSNYTIPYWQTNVSMAANNGSTTYRCFPDVACTSDAIEVVYNNGSSGLFGGTSGAAPLWAGFTALINQQAVASGSAPMGFLNPALYRLAASANYASAFHDITTGNNIGTNSPGLYYAVAGYDLATGLGTPNGTNLINALAPPTLPYFLSQPSSQTAIDGANVTFSASAGGHSPLYYQWRLNGTNLPAGGNVSGTTSSTLSLSSVTPANDGNYSVLVTNSYGSATSSVATLTVNLLSSALTLSSSLNLSGFRDSLVFSAAVTPPDATGSVQFMTNGMVFDNELVAAGQAGSRSLASLPRGTNLITASYSGDASHLPATGELYQIVTNHPPVALPAFYVYTSGLPLNIAIANLATNWSDVDGDVVSLAAVSVSTNGITLANNGITLIYFNTNSVAHQFTCTISDGFGGTNFQTVTLSTSLPRSITPFITGVVPAGNGSVTLNLSGAPGSTYILQAATNLSGANWQPIVTNTLGTNGVWQFDDAQATNFVQRFYRLQLAQ